MTRTDGVLYTGARTHEVREEQKRVKQERRTQLLPAAQIVTDEIEKERLITEKTILGFISVGTPKDDVKEILAALNLYDQSMTNLSNKLKNILRASDKPPEVEQDV